MNTSVIRYRVADFLKRHAPFDAVPEAELLELATQGRVKFHESDEYVHRAGQARTPFVWIIQQGRVELSVERADGPQLLDVLGEGDILGLDRFAGDGTYRSTARTTSDVILYALQAAAFEELLARHAAVERFLAAHFSVSAAGSGRTSWLDAEPPPLEFLRCRGEAAEGLPALAAEFTTRDAVRAMLDGQTEAAAVDGAALTADDLALFCNYNPARLRREIERARTGSELTTLVRLAGRVVVDGLARSSDVDDCARMATEFVAAATAACIRFAEAEAGEAGFDPPAARYAWLSYGALARGELLRFAPPMVGMVFDDADVADMADAALYGAVVAGRVTDWLHKCGLHGPEGRWPDGSHACMPLSSWRGFFTETVRDPAGVDLFARREFFDLRALSGDAGFIDELRGWLRGELSDSQVLVPLLANETLGNLPPLTFFSGLVVALDGTESRHLDLAETALHPIADAARVFALAAGIPEVSTFARLEAAAGQRPEQAQVFRDAADAYRIALFHRAQAGSDKIEPGRLARLDQRLLKTAFASILRLLELASLEFTPV